MHRLIALMLGRLRLSTEDAIKAYGRLSKQVFSTKKKKGDGTFKAKELEGAVKSIIKSSSSTASPGEHMMDRADIVCKTYVLCQVTSL
jgi:hypothetical protein